MLAKTELLLLQAFLRKTFGNEDVRVTTDARDQEAGAVLLGERQIAMITVDDEDGDRSFALEMKIPVGRPVLQEYLQRLFENDKLKIVARAKKNDSVELNNGPDHVGIISADNPQASSFTLQMSILDFDLEDL